MKLILDFFIKIRDFYSVIYFIHKKIFLLIFLIIDKCYYCLNLIYLNLNID